MANPVRLFPTNFQLPWRGAAVAAALFLGCLLPRLAITSQKGVICSDAVYFLERAEAFEQGDLAATTATLELNLYPLWLALLHRTGTDWLPVAAMWSNIAASLVVIPLFFGARRAFGSACAFVTAGIYAAHPETLRWSGEAIRDATFWFVLLIGLAAIESAAQRPSAWRYGVAGMIAAVAMLLRLEGGFLWLPLAYYGTRWAFSCRRDLRQVILGSALVIMSYPALVLCLNLTAFAANDHWELGRLAHAQTLWDRVDEWLREPPSTGEIRVSTEGTPPDSAPRERPNLATSTYSVIWTIGRGISFPVLGLIATGIAYAGMKRKLRGDWMRFALVGCWIAAIVVEMWIRGDTTKRYAVPIFLMFAAYAGFGVVAISAAAGQIFRRIVSSPRLGTMTTVRAATATALVVGMFVFGYRDVTMDGNASRHLKADAGGRIADRFGEGRSMVCSANLDRLVRYYAKAPRSLVIGLKRGMLFRIEAERPELIVLWTASDAREVELVPPLAARLEYRRLPEEELPSNCRDVAIWVRGDLAEKTHSTGGRGRLARAGR